MARGAADGGRVSLGHHRHHQQQQKAVTMNDITDTTATMPTSEGGMVQDLQLAKALGYTRPANIRNLIKRNLAILGTMGIIAPRKAVIEAGKGAQREVEEYHLNRTQAAFIAARSSTKRGAVTAAYMADVEALFHAGHLVVADTPEAEAALKAAQERDRERRLLLMREEKDDYSRIVKGFGRSPSRKVIGTNPDGSPILSELAPFEKRRAEERAARRRR